jgi:hypothetical protein
VFTARRGTSCVTCYDCGCVIKNGEWTREPQSPFVKTDSPPRPPEKADMLISVCGRWAACRTEDVWTVKRKTEAGLEALEALPYMPHELFGLPEGTKFTV